MALALVLYIVIGVLIGLLTRIGSGETSTLAGVAGTAGVGGLVGGVIANLVFSGGVTLDLAGVLGAVVLAIVAVLVKRTADRSRQAQAPAGDEG